MNKIRNRRWKRLTSEQKLNNIKADWENWEDCSDIESEIEGFDEEVDVQPDNRLCENNDKSREDLKVKLKVFYQICKDLYKNELENIFPNQNHDKFGRSSPYNDPRATILDFFMWTVRRDFETNWKEDWDNDLPNYIAPFKGVPMPIYFHQFETKTEVEEWLASGMSKEKQVQEYFENYSIEDRGKYGALNPFD